MDKTVCRGTGGPYTTGMCFIWHFIYRNCAGPPPARLGLRT